MFQVFHMTSEKVLDPVYAPIEFGIDIGERTARVKVPGYIDGHGEPILNPVTGAKKHARIELENGFEFKVAEVGRGWFESKGGVRLKNADTHAHFCKIHLTERGIPS